VAVSRALLYVKLVWVVGLLTDRVFAEEVMDVNIRGERRVSPYGVG